FPGGSGPLPGEKEEFLRRESELGASALAANPARLEHLQCAIRFVPRRTHPRPPSPDRRSRRSPSWSGSPKETGRGVQPRKGASMRKISVEPLQAFRLPRRIRLRPQQVLEERQRIVAMGRSGRNRRRHVDPSAEFAWERTHQLNLLVREN